MSARAYALDGGRFAELARLTATHPMMDAVIDEVRGREIRVGDHWLVDFASCNYLGFDLDPQIQQAIGPAVEKWGTHPSWSRMLGSPALYPQIEERLADLLGAPDALVLPTVTLIHMAVVPVLAGTGTVLHEHNAHRTIYDACRYARGLGATVHRFRAGDLGDLERLLRGAAPGEPRLVCVDGVNSMTGNPPDLGGYARLCREYGALLYVDDAHGFGLLGERRPDETSPYGARGNAVVRWCGESYDNIVLVGGFSKAYSSLLAFIAVPTAVKEHLKVAAPPYLYSGPSPTASLATVLAGFDVNEARGDQLRGRLYALTARVLERVRALGLATPNTSGTPIVELPLAPGRDLAEVATRLWRRGVYVTLAAYPLVSRADVGLRIQLTAAHTDADVDRLLAVLRELAARGDLRTEPGPVAPRQARPGPDS
ncbi:aminotransferase class I/II-fold pyridoxal phosphate-dependent enzyme [Phytohabitans suffuscus]|uniref:8-amino-7-oxononanoate synthase n=1 Tax=Phytohabitans suffuscus TaxID=624315 RepID=A0A6F8YYW8_9ACTN|nr:pyridoxal phosphate-dependent aminotransferase family protein [Phytohabitans suffuscus]BCB91279.1 2-amino-3-ketobutyrate CoA ligase [Phytohabitans suffuscus]